MEESQKYLEFKNFIDLFKEADYPKDAEGFTQVPPNVIYEALHSLFPFGYKEDVNEGFYPDGRNYVRLTLTVEDPAGGPFKASVTGYAEAPINKDGTASVMSFAGLITMARRQAVLRGLHMGHSMYAKHAEKETTTTTPVAPVAAASKTYTPAAGGSRPAYGGGGGARKPFTGDGSDWMGTARIKSENSPHKGKMWKELPIEVVQKMASGSNPIQLAVWELQRRGRELAGAVTAAVDASGEDQLDAAIAEVDSRATTGSEAPTSAVAGTMAGNSFQFRR